MSIGFPIDITFLLCLERPVHNSIHSEDDEEAYFSAMDYSHSDAKVQTKDSSGCVLSDTCFELLAFLLSSWAYLRTLESRAKHNQCGITHPLGFIFEYQNLDNPYGKNETTGPYFQVFPSPTCRTCLL